MLLFFELLESSDVDGEIPLTSQELLRSDDRWADSMLFVNCLLFWVVHTIQLFMSHRPDSLHLKRQNHFFRREVQEPSLKRLRQVKWFT